jgi:hypothetical protein
MSYYRPQEFIAKGVLHRGQHQFSAVAKGIINPLLPDPVNCIIVQESQEEQPNGIGNSLTHEAYDYPLPVEFSGVEQNGRQIYIKDLIPTYTTSFSGNITSYEGSATLILTGDLDRTDFTGRKIKYSFFISPTPLAIPAVSYINSYDGTITIGGDRTRDGISFQLEGRNYELNDNYTYIDDSKGPNKAITRIQSCTLTVNIESKRTASFRDYLELIDIKLKNVFWILSFLSRKRVVWYACEALGYPTDGIDDGFKTMLAKRHIGASNFIQKKYDDDWLDLLVTREGLENGGLQNLILNFQNSPHQQSILRAIKQLVLSYDDGYLESNLGYVYGALECLVNSVDYDGRISGPIIQKKDFSRLKHEVINSIKNHVADEQASEATIARIDSLNNRGSRGSFSSRLLRSLTDCKVEVKQLFPQHTVISHKLDEINLRRNEFIHEARLDYPVDYYIDFERYRIIAELWILKLLQYPDEQVNPHGIRRSLPPESI